MKYLLFVYLFVKVFAICYLLLVRCLFTISWYVIYSLVCCLVVQPLIRERAVSALRACLRLTAQRESKEDANSLNYHVCVGVV